MDAKILTQPPISGKYEEHYFLESGESLWVKFTDDEYVEWIGVFEKSECELTSHIICVPNKKLYLVIAAGQGYYIDPNSRRIINRTEWDNIENIIYNQASSSFIVTDGLRIGILKDAKMVWISNRISADGIHFTRQDGVLVHGVLNDLTSECCDFVFNTKTKDLKANWIFSKDWS